MRAYFYLFTDWVLLGIRSIWVLSFCSGLWVSCLWFRFRLWRRPELLLLAWSLGAGNDCVRHIVRIGEVGVHRSSGNVGVSGFLWVVLGICNGLVGRLVSWLLLVRVRRLFPFWSNHWGGSLISVWECFGHCFWGIGRLVRPVAFRALISNSPNLNVEEKEEKYESLLVKLNLQIRSGFYARSCVASGLCPLDCG